MICRMGETHDPTDWTGVAPDRSPVAPLDARTFVERLRRLSERAEALTLLRQSLADQNPGGQPVHRPAEPTPRPSR
jgi:hypothetical protein